MDDKIIYTVKDKRKLVYSTDDDLDLFKYIYIDTMDGEERYEYHWYEPDMEQWTIEPDLISTENLKDLLANKWHERIISKDEAKIILIS